MRSFWLGLGVLAATLCGGAPGIAAAQVRTIDPNQAIDGDLSAQPSQYRAGQSVPQTTTQPSRPADQDVPAEPTPTPTPAPPPATNAQRPETRAEATMQAADTYERDDLLAAGEGVFGKGAAGLGGILENILKDQGQPNAYIAGREASGAFILGVRYGSGIMSHKVEGQQPVYWTGPSVGFDVGGDANKVFVLVYNLYDTEELYKRFPAVEGRLYLVGGFAATYLRRGNVVLIPIRLGVGWRAGVNVGYMNITHKSRWLPF
ncbi:DUF1134 domain-containing protein [Sphingomonas sp. CFBP 13603]|uniref:DUF1134 domain-containing protein n=1 Tax=Sphingomonas sp. CFBP 13603 TaxID=2774040 RepID=UPI001867B3C3|nr:DUF1134 domain-containing protein [Sphingomonas sp. CFBP 13603]MBE2991624.1 DUF1134 domain-containing protein [Sphingomonas sp. CFBP 13603]